MRKRLHLASPQCAFALLYDVIAVCSREAARTRGGLAVWSREAARTRSILLLAQPDVPPASTLRLKSSKTNDNICFWRFKVQPWFRSPLSPQSRGMSTYPPFKSEHLPNSISFSPVIGGGALSFRTSWWSRQMKVEEHLSMVFWDFLEIFSVILRSFWGDF